MRLSIIKSDFENVRTILETENTRALSKRKQQHQTLRRNRLSSTLAHCRDRHTNFVDLAGDMMDHHFRKSFLHCVRAHVCCHADCSLRTSCLVGKQTVLQLHKVAGLDRTTLVDCKYKDRDNWNSRKPRRRHNLSVRLEVSTCFMPFASMSVTVAD